MKPAIIFDLDGTLWNATGSACAIWNRVFERHGVDLRMTQELVEKTMGKSMWEIAEFLFPEKEEKERMAIVDDFGDEEVIYLTEHGGILYEGVAESLAELSAENDLFIVSNAQDGYVQAFLHAHNLGKYFRDYEMSGRTGKDKGPNIVAVMERNGVEKAVYVGDTADDEKAARYAGIPFIWANYGFGRAVAPDGELTIENWQFAMDEVSGVRGQVLENAHSIPLYPE